MSGSSSSCCTLFPLWKHRGRPTAGRGSSCVASHFQPHQYWTSPFKFSGWFESAVLEQLAVLRASCAGRRQTEQGPEPVPSRRSTVCLVLVSIPADFMSGESKWAVHIMTERAHTHTHSLPEHEELGIQLILYSYHHGNWTGVWMEQQRSSTLSPAM